MKKELFFFWLRRKRRKGENARKFHIFIFKWTSKENPSLHKAPFLNLPDELVINHPSKHGLLETHICTSINMKQESREA